MGLFTYIPSYEEQIEIFDRASEAIINKRHNVMPKIKEIRKEKI